MIVTISIRTAAATLLLSTCVLSAQVMTNAQRAASAGDAETTVTAVANLSPKLTKKDLTAAMKLAADWQLDRARSKFNQDWTYATLYSGLMALPPSVGGSKYQDALLELGKKSGYIMGPAVENSNDQAVGRTYTLLYEKNRDPAMIAPAVERAEHLLKHVDDPDKLLWHWCDALFMGPPAFTQLYVALGKKQYLDFMDHEWWLASDEMYSTQYHLYYRDKSFIPKHEANGKPLFWSRGNGWVMGAFAQVLTDMPIDYPSRPKYVAQFKEMAAAIAALQGSDGLWRPGLLDAGAYPLPETSGSAFYVYALTWGINHGLLDRKTYLPVVERGWAGLLSHVYADGRLGCVQPIGSAPGQYAPTASYVYGVGAYLLAGSELYKLAK